MTAHSKIGPSALHRLLACPASHKLSSKYPAGGSSVFAAEGSVAHEIVEAMLLGHVPHGLGDVITYEGHDIVVDDEMLDGCNQMVAFCEPLKKDAQRVWIERRVDLGPLWLGNPPEPIFGTVDFAAHNTHSDVLYVVDFKYGRIPVSPFDNPQAFAYALGACYEMGRFPRQIVIVIVQPRDSEPVKVTQITGLDLQMWADDVLQPGVDRCFDPTAPLATGDHCRFCPAKIDCPALYALAKKTARTDFSYIPPDPLSFTDRELGDIMNGVAVATMWFEAVRAEVAGRIEKGKAVPNWKLVPKRAMRRWADQQEAEKHLLADGAYYDLKIKSPTQIEKIDPRMYEELDSRHLIVKQSSGTTLAPETDPRDAVPGNKAGRDDFEVIDHE